MKGREGKEGRGRKGEWKGMNEGKEGRREGNEGLQHTFLLLVNWYS